MDAPASIDRLSWVHLDRRPAPLLVIPVGSCEQHGPHLPLGTDTLIATALAERLVAELESGTAVLAPALGVTASGEHQGFAGTLSIGTEVMRSVVVELVRSATWAAAVVLVNGHGGNHDAVRAATDQLTREGHRVLAWWPRIADADADLHAGAVETSLMLALHPDLVGPLPPADGTGADLDTLRSHGVAAVSASGVLGDPTAATADRGRELLRMLTDDLVTRTRHFVDGS